MRLTKHRRKTTAAMDMTPMIDITFQLMIFFMACSQISKANNENIELPKLPGSVDQQEDTALKVNIDAAGDIKVTGRRLSLNEFIVEVGRLKKEKEPAPLKVSIRAYRHGTSRKVNEVLKSLNEMGVRNVNVGVDSSE